MTDEERAALHWLIYMAAKDEGYSRVVRGIGHTAYVLALRAGLDRQAAKAASRLAREWASALFSRSTTV